MSTVCLQPPRNPELTRGFICRHSRFDHCSARARAKPAAVFRLLVIAVGADGEAGVSDWWSQGAGGAIQPASIQVHGLCVSITDCTGADHRLGWRADFGQPANLSIRDLQDCREPWLGVWLGLIRGLESSIECHCVALGQSIYGIRHCPARSTIAMLKQRGIQLNGSQGLNGDPEWAFNAEALNLQAERGERPWSRLLAFMRFACRREALE